jgi:hypothetical protein
MKAGAVRHPNNFDIISTTEQIIPPHFNQNEEITSPILRDLGFEEDELDMFFDTVDITRRELIQRYLEISRESPYNLIDWTNENIAAEAPYITNIIKSNGVAYTKHDIVEDTLNSFYDQQNSRGGKLKKQKTKRTKKTKRTMRTKKTKRSKRSKKKKTSNKRKKTMRTKNTHMYKN